MKKTIAIVTLFFALCAVDSPLSAAHYYVYPMHAQKSSKRVQLCQAIQQHRVVMVEIYSKYEGSEWIQIVPYAVGRGRDGRRVLLGRHIDSYTANGHPTGDVKTIYLRDIYSVDKTNNYFHTPPDLERHIYHHLESVECAAKEEIK
ncbi:MAG: hypothetical protein KDK78_03380 [Chlamydiia bacterium]|nr:hypothetical protein [Chlamydiia bacterium]